MQYFGEWVGATTTACCGWGSVRRSVPPHSERVLRRPPAPQFVPVEGGKLLTFYSLWQGSKTCIHGRISPFICIFSFFPVYPKTFYAGSVWAGIPMVWYWWTTTPYSGVAEKLSSVPFLPFCQHLGKHSGIWTLGCHTISFPRPSLCHRDVDAQW